jgi:hypothetical protein
MQARLSRISPTLGAWGSFARVSRDGERVGGTLAHLAE